MERREVIQDPIPPGGRSVYEFTLHQAGTFFYHSHMAMQEMMGMIGPFIMHPKENYDPPVDKDFTIILQEFAILPHNPIPNSMNMEFNWLTLNGKSGPATTPLIVRLNDRVRLRFINLGMDHHPIHVHGHTFVVTGTEAGRQPQSTWGPGSQCESPDLLIVIIRMRRGDRFQECSKQLSPAQSWAQPGMRCGLLLQLWQMRLPSGPGQGHATQLYLRAPRRSPTP